MKSSSSLLCGVHVDLQRGLPLHLQYAQCSFSAHQGCESSYDVSVASNGVHALQMEQARHLQWEPVGAARHVQGTLAARHAQARQLDGLVMA